MPAVGNVKFVTKKLIFDLYHKFGVRGSVRKRPVPHVSLFGPFRTNSIREVIEIMKRVGDNYSSFNYEIDGFDYFERKTWKFIIPRKKKHAIFLKVIPDFNSADFRHALATELLSKKKAEPKNKSIDSDIDFEFHATLAMKDIHHKFEDIWDYLKRYPIKANGVCYRITLLKASTIVCEYDFVQKKILGRREALSRRSWAITEKLLKANQKAGLKNIDETQFYGCPNCGEDTVTKNGKEYCNICNIFL